MKILMVSCPAGVRMDKNDRNIKQYTKCEMKATKFFAILDFQKYPR